MRALFPFVGTGLRDPEDRAVNEQDPFEIREKMLDKTIADSFPPAIRHRPIPLRDADSFAQ